MALSGYSSLPGHSLENKILIIAVFGLNSDLLSISVFTIWLTETAHVHTLQAVLSAWTAESGATPFTTALHQFQDNLGCSGKGGWDSLQSLTILTPSMRWKGPDQFHHALELLLLLFPAIILISSLSSLTNGSFALNTSSRFFTVSP